MKVLFITKFIPFPSDNGGKIGTLNLLKCLSEIADIDYISFYENEDELKYKKKLNEICNSVKLFYKRISLERDKKKNFYYFAKSMVNGKPYFVEKFYSSELEKYLNGIKLEKYNLIIVDGLNMSQYIKSNNNCILQEHNIEFQILERYYTYEKNLIKKMFFWIDYNKLRNYEIKVIKNFQNIIYFTEYNKKIIEEKFMIEHKPFVIPVSVDTNLFPRLEEEKINFRKELFSNGALTYDANFDGLLWFDKHVLPLIKMKHLDIKVHHIGKFTEYHRKKLSSDIILEGYVDDINDSMNSNIIHIVPLRIGGGIRVKILNSLSAGIPIVATGMAAEGINVLDHESISIADSPIEFSKKVIELLEDNQLRKKYIKNGKQIIDRYYSINIVNEQIKQVLKNITK